MDNKECVLLICSCDAYEDALNPFFKLLKKYWPDLSFKIILSTESLEYKNEYFKIKNIHPHNKECSWTERIADTLNQIQEKYILFMLDDFYLYDYVKTEKINNCLKLLKKNKKIATFTFWPIFCITQNIKFNEFLKRKKGERNKVAAIAGIWNKKKLLKYLEGYKETAWQWEQNATARSNGLFNNDEFYVLKNSQDNYIPYDFTKYGLFSGKWIKTTLDLFDKENIKVDYTKRGFYDESLKGLEKSITSIFKIDSAVIPSFGLEHQGSSYIKNKKSKETRYINQEYKVNGARDIIRWEPAILSGFGIENLIIEVDYKNQTKEIIDNNNLFGNFILKEKILLFNSPAPYINIPITENKIISKIRIKGNLKHPLSKEQLRSSYLKETLPCEKFKQLDEKIYYEFLASKEKVGFLHINSEIKVFSDKSEEALNNFKEEFSNRNFIIKIKTKKEWNKLTWTPNKYNGYAIKKLEIRIKNSKDKTIKLENIANLPLKEKDTYYFLSNYPIEIELNKDIKEIIISGKFICPIKSKILKKYLIK